MTVNQIVLIKTDAKKVTKWTVVIGIFAILAVVYKIFNPGLVEFFPNCFFHKTTGYKCPICGSQMAVHYLMNFELAKAFTSNALLVLAIPYILITIAMDIIKSPDEKVLKLKNIFTGKKTVMGIGVIVVLFWILRNV